jgi:hypothetical protein
MSKPLDDEAIVPAIQELIASDDSNDGDRIRERYETSAPGTQQAIDDIFISMCGYSLKTILAGDAT